MRRRVAVLGAVLLLAGGCSDGGGERGAAGPPAAEAPSASVTSTAVVEVTTTAPTATSSVATTRPGGTATTASTPPTPTTAPSAAGPAVAEAGGWRLVISRPTARATIPPAAVVCYEATGSTREPELVLEVTALPPGTVTRIPVSVGRGTAQVDLGAAGTGARDLRIRLIPNGQTIEGLAVTVPVTIAAGAAAGAC